jgi:hypothetical protein
LLFEIGLLPRIVETFAVLGSAMVARYRRSLDRCNLEDVTDRLSQNVGTYSAMYASQYRRTEIIQSLFFLTSLHDAQCKYTVWAEGRILSHSIIWTYIFVHKILLLYLAYIYEIIREIRCSYIPYTVLISEDYARAHTRAHTHTS